MLKNLRKLGKDRGPWLVARGPWRKRLGLTSDWRRATGDGLGILIVLTILLSGCAQASGNRTPLEYLPNMMDQPAIKAQAEPTRLPVSGTLPRDYEPYPFKLEEGDLAGATLKNPMALSKASLDLGQKAYHAYCAVCHGPVGKGNGSIVPKFPMPPSLQSEKMRQWSDGRIYHVITRGQNLMPAYASQVLPNERWAAIFYLRALQRAVRPTDEDVKAFQKALEEKRYP